MGEYEVVNYTYDSESRIIKVAAQSGYTEYTYDSEGLRGTATYDPVHSYPTEYIEEKIPPHGTLPATPPA